jgi:hypothetical protein
VREVETKKANLPTTDKMNYFKARAFFYSGLDPISFSDDFAIKLNRNPLLRQRKMLNSDCKLSPAGTSRASPFISMRIKPGKLDFRPTGSQVIKLEKA